MATIRNVAGEARWIPDAGVTVEDHETFEVDDDLFDQRSWPETMYEVVEAPKKTKKTTKKAAAAGGKEEG